MKDELHIYEEATNLFWGLIVLVCTTLATYILANSFITDGWSFSSLNQILALLLFAISFIGIFKLSDPLLHFVFEADQKKLSIHIYRGEEEIDIQYIRLDNIKALKFEPYTSRSANEALFDFSPNYQLMWLPETDSDYRPLIDLDETSFTLKVDDIASIIRYIRRHQGDIEVPKEQASFFGL